MILPFNVLGHVFRSETRNSGLSTNESLLVGPTVEIEIRIRRKFGRDSESHAKGAGVAKLIIGPTIVQAAGNRPKMIEEYAGLVNSGHEGVSIARMVSPGGWQEPGQRPEFEEISVVLRGTLRVEHEGGTLDVRAGQAVVSQPGEWVRYSTPDADGAEYIAVCFPAFSLQTVHRDDS
jgi:mannose-6-phosphate isomerase-like protein (cupin superfamily)